MTKLVIILLICPIVVKCQVFSSLILGNMVRSDESYQCETGSHFHQITRSSLIRSFRPDCHKATIRGEGRNKYQAIDGSGRSGLFDADVERLFTVFGSDEAYLLTYSQTGKVIEHSSFAECNGDQLAVKQEYLYDANDCRRDYLHLQSVKAELNITGHCRSVCTGSVTLK